jgi:hypothetical protein
MTADYVDAAQTAIKAYAENGEVRLQAVYELAKAKTDLLRAKNLIEHDVHVQTANEKMTVDVRKGFVDAAILGDTDVQLVVAVVLSLESKIALLDLKMQVADMYYRLYEGSVRAGK